MTQARQRRQIYALMLVMYELQYSVCDATGIDEYTTKSGRQVCNGGKVLLTVL